MDDLISRSWLLSEYDKRHKGPPGGARKLIEEAPSALGTDCISRQAAIGALRNYLVGKNVPCDGTLTARLIENEVINKLPPAQSESFEWCTDCKEYDQEAHCCHRWSKMIRKTAEEMQIVWCRDCRYYNAEEKECLDLLGHGRRWEEDDFCSYGAKMEVTE